MDNSKNKQVQENMKHKWLPCKQIHDVPTRRRAKPTNWYIPPDTGRKKEKDFSLIQENEYCNRELILPKDIKSYWKNISNIANDPNATVIKDMATLLAEADVEWETDET